LCLHMELLLAHLLLIRVAALLVHLVHVLLLLERQLLSDHILLQGQQCIARGCYAG
jgi:hypothetical protein